MLSRFAQCGHRRDPEQTRKAILEAAFEEIHVQGFRNASLDNILKKTGLTKGALYHHFPNKNALGYAVLEEMIMPHYYAEWAPLKDESRNPIDALVLVLQRVSGERMGEFLATGCPVNNLIQEMSGLDEGFRQRLLGLLDQWVQLIQRALERGQREGKVRMDMKATDSARMIVSTFQGCAGFAKCSQNEAIFRDCLQSLIRFCENLRTP